MMGPNAGEAKEGQPEKKERNLLRTPLCFFVICVPNWGEGGGGEEEGRNVKERAQMDHTG